MIYIVLLRGVNVAGKNKIVMKEFVNKLSAYNKIDTIKSYIQSGNFVLNCNQLNSQEIEVLFKEFVLKNYDYSIDVFCYTIDEFISIKNNHSYPITENKNYYTFYKNSIKESKALEFSAIDFKEDLYTIHSNVIHICYSISYSKSKINNNFIEKKLEVIATTRNYNTIQKLISLAKTIS